MAKDAAEWRRFLEETRFSNKKQAISLYFKATESIQLEKDNPDVLHIWLQYIRLCE